MALQLGSLAPLIAAHFVAATPISLSEALHRAEHAAYAVRASRHEAAARRADARGPLRGVLPGVRLETGYMRSNDPLGAFGTRLRQSEVSPLDFDPTRLNEPEPLGNWGAAVVAEVPLLNLDAWAARRAALDAASAADADAEWAEDEALLNVVRAYYGALVVREQVSTLEAALVAAKAHVDQAAALQRSGVATDADTLLASVKAGEIEAGLIEARLGATLALRGLAVVIGDGHDAAAPREGLPTAERVRRLAAGLPSAGVGERADLRASLASAEAAAGDERRTRAALLPRLNAVGRLDWNHPDGPFRSDASWTVGVMLTWAPFSGGAELGAIDAASARASAARVMAEAGQARADLESSRTADAVAVALERLRISERSVEQSAEAHRIVAKKYDGGLTGVSELLEAAATETAARLAYADARHRVVVAAAEYHHAHGLDVRTIAEALERP